MGPTRDKLSVVRIATDQSTGEGVGCPDCEVPLVLVQPDEQRPERILGACESCEAWFLVRPGALARLPIEDFFEGEPSAAGRRGG